MTYISNNDIGLIKKNKNKELIKIKSRVKKLFSRKNKESKMDISARTTVYKSVMGSLKGKLNSFPTIKRAMNNEVIDRDEILEFIEGDTNEVQLISVSSNNLNLKDPRNMNDSQYKRLTSELNILRDYLNSRIDKSRFIVTLDGDWDDMSLILEHTESINEELEVIDMDMEFYNYLTESLEDQILLTEESKKKKNILSRAGNATFDTMMKIVNSSITLDKAETVVTKRTLLKMKKKMATEGDRKKINKIIDNSITGLNKYMKRNTKAITKRRSEKKEKHYVEFIQWLKEFKKEVNKVDLNEGKTLKTESGNPVFVTSDIDLALEKLNEDDFFAEDVDVLLRDE